MYFTAVFVAAAVVFNFFGKITDFTAAVKFGGVDVLAVYIEFDGIKVDNHKRLSLIQCLNETFSFGPNEADSRFASACTGALKFDNFRTSFYYEKMSSPFNPSSGCVGSGTDNKNSLGNDLKRLKSHMDGMNEFRAKASVVTIIFAVPNLNNDLDKYAEAMYFVNQPNQMYLAIEGLPTDTSNLAKNGIVSNHLFNVPMEESCTEFINKFQRLICAPNGDPPKTNGICVPTENPEKCEIKKTYATALKDGGAICGDLLIEKVECTCETTTTMTTSSESVAVTTAAKKDDGIPVGIILGIVFSIIAVIAIVAVAVWFFVFRGKKARHGFGGTVSGAPDHSRSVQASVANQSQTSLVKERSVNAKIAKSPASKVAQSPSAKIAQSPAGGSQNSKVAQSPSAKIAQSPASKNVGGSQKSPSKRVGSQSKTGGGSKMAKSVVSKK